jgi:hypothetical protein
VSKEGVAIVVKIINKFTKFVIDALYLHEDNLFNCMLLESLAVVHECASSYDVECHTSVM